MMKKLFCALLVLALSSAGLLVAQGAEGSASGFTADGGGAIYYAPRFNTGIPIADIILALKGGVYVDGEIMLGGGFSAGAELGFYYIQWETSSSNFMLMDVPIVAKASFDLDFLELQAYGGVLFNLDLMQGGQAQTNYTFGGKINLSGLMIDGGYVIAAGTPYHVESVAAYPRFGIGYQFRLGN